MNKELRHTNIFESATCEVFVPTFKKQNASSINFGLAFFISISSIQPKSTELDYIEAKTTLGGEQISSSTSQIPLSHQFESVCNAKTATYDLTQLRDNAAKFNSRGIIDTFEMNVKGLIELMCQF